MPAGEYMFSCISRNINSDNNYNALKMRPVVPPEKFAFQIYSQVQTGVLCDSDPDLTGSYDIQGIFKSTPFIPPKFDIEIQRQNRVIRGHTIYVDKMGHNAGIGHTRLFEGAPILQCFELKQATMSGGHFVVFKDHSAALLTYGSGIHFLGLENGRVTLV